MEQRSACGAERRRRRAWASAFAVLLALGLAGCAPEHAWQPPGWPQSAGVALIADVDDPESLYEGAPEAEEKAEVDYAVLTGEMPALEFTEGRIRNDGVSLQARYVDVPGHPAFNEKVAQVIWDAIGGEETEYTPEAHKRGSGLGDRGCVAGSLGWEASRLLFDDATGPHGGSGVAVTCEPVFAQGDVVGVGMRVVEGTPDRITKDSTVVVYGDLESGEAFLSTEMWTPDAAEALWTAAIDQLRRQAGSLSAEPIAKPSRKQLAIARDALDDPIRHDDGSATFVLWDRLEAPELEALGIDDVPEATAVRVDGDLVRSWSNDFEAVLERAKGQPFAGMPAWTADHPVDCDLLSCVAVTYDDGPAPDTSRLLDELRRLKAPATFYVLGGYVDGNPDPVRRAAEDGHEVASHTMTHPSLPGLPVKSAVAEVLDAADAIAEVTGRPVTQYRPPYGALTDKIAKRIGLPAIFWSIDTNDWRKPGKKALVARSASVARPGDIILFHDLHSDSVDVAPQVMRQLRDRGLTPVTVTQLFEGEVPEGRVFRRGEVYEW